MTTKKRNGDGNDDNNNKINENGEIVVIFGNIENNDDRNRN